MTLTDPAVPDTLANLRDVGVAAAGLRNGVLLRSDAPLPGDRTDTYAVAWPPRTVIDLRDHDEPASPDHPLSDVAEVVTLPLLDGRTSSVSTLPASLADLYVDLLSAPKARRLVWAMEAIAHGEAPVLVHCTAGKDRTGVTIAVALRLVGVAPAAIIADYTRTAAAMDGVRARISASFAPSRQLDLSAVPPGVAAGLMGAPAEAMAATLAVLADHPGGAVGWFLAHGGDQATIDALRDRLLLDNRPGRVPPHGELR